MRVRPRAIKAAVTMVSALAVTALVAPGGAANAVATTAHLPSVKTAAYQPLRGSTVNSIADTSFNNVDYNGGPIMPSNTDYLVLWSPSGLSAYGPGATPEYVSGIEQYFKDLAHDSGGHQNADSVSTQYNDLTGAAATYSVKFGGALIDSDAYPTSQCPVNSPVTACLTDSLIQHELERFVAAHHLPTDLSHEYFLLTPPHIESCFNNSGGASPPYGGCSAGIVPSNLGAYCAYHENTTVSPMLLYANDPYVVGNGACDDGNHPNGPSDGALEGGLSHEHNESISDPIPNDAWTNGAGANHGEEIGDQCDGQMGSPLGTAPDGARYNQVINGHFYWYQEEWSNAGHTCLQRFTPPGSLPTAKFSVSAGSGRTMTFDATGSTAPGGIAEYVWQFNDAFGVQTIAQTTPKITHVFPANGSYSVGLTIDSSTGLSRGTGAIVTTGKSGFTAGFTSSPVAPAAGQVVHFSALTTISRKPVVTFLWEFGDGKTGSGSAPSHTYAKAGSYTVTLVMFSGVGSAFPGAGAAPIATSTVRVS